MRKTLWLGPLTLACVLQLTLDTQAAAPSILTAVTPDGPVLPLDDVGLYRVGYVLRGKPPVEFAVGRHDFDDPPTGTTFRTIADHDGLPATFVHPPWRNAAGTAFQEFLLTLPAARKILLRGATALDHDTEKSDGVTFRILANGKTLLDTHHQQTRWQPFECDLTALAGTTVTLRFETDPGPNDDTGWDHALWGARQLLCDGYTGPARAATPPPPPLDVPSLAALAPARSRGATPPAAYPTRISTTLDADTALLTATNAAGTFSYRWNRPRDSASGFLGQWQFSATYPGAPDVQTLALARDADLTFTAPAQLQSTRWEVGANAITLVSLYQVGSRPATVRITATLAGDSLVLEVSCDQPVIAEMHPGSWEPCAIRRPIPIPYYGSATYLPQESLFTNSFIDWTASSAADLNDNRANYPALFAPPPKAPPRNLLQERLIFAAARHLAQVLPNIPNPPSPWRAELADKIVLDIWGGRFADIAAKLETLHSYGLDHCAVILHNWQRSGYDNALPQHFPANASLGGDPDLKTLTATARRLGYLIALHENYVDYYPNFEGFNEDDIARDSTGQRQLAWFNPGTKIQSFAEKPAIMLHYAQQQAPEIQRHYQSNASFVDVCSAVEPWFHVDFRASEPGAGRLDTVLRTHAELWALERAIHGGPVFGEGNHHMYWSGLLDGAEAQFGTGWPEGQGRTAPLSVTFDLLKIHPLQLNHGMGYYERWSGKASWSALPPMAVLDQYRMQEIAYGHAGFLSGEAWQSIPAAWLEHHLVSPVTARSATANATLIAYQVDGRWVDSSTAARQQNEHCVRIAYDNGLVIAANDTDTPLPDADVTLPRGGWSARGTGLTAYTALRHNTLVDYAETPTSVFANARCASDFRYVYSARIAPQLVDMSFPAPRTLKFTYQWRVDDPLDADYTAFVHFLGPAPASGTAQEDAPIRFQQDHNPKIPTSQWKPGQTVTDGPFTITIPTDLADGDYPWMIGLYTPHTPRVRFAAGDEAPDRVRLGTLHVRDGGIKLTVDLAPPLPPATSDLYAQHLNAAPAVIDFGPVRTDGSVLIRREGLDWVLYPFPRTRRFTVQLRADRFGSPETVACDGGDTPMLHPAPADGSFWTLALHGAAQYRWPASTLR